jgi:glucosylceramidase
MKQAMSIATHKVKFFGSPWSPPAWMKSNHKISFGGQLKGTVGGEYWQSWANYFVKYL